MADPRDVALDNKVQGERKHHGEVAVPDGVQTPQPGKQPALVPDDLSGDNFRRTRLHPEDLPEEG